MNPNWVKDNHLPAERRPVSVAELACRIEEPAFEAIRRLYTIRRIPTSRLFMDATGWEAAARAMGRSRQAVEQQVVIAVRERFLDRETMLNPLRNRRAPTVDEPLADRVMAAADAARDCRWCGAWHVRNASLWSDAWEPAWSNDRRVGTRPNWARQSLISGLAFGDEGMHQLDALTEQEFVGLYEAAESYIALARCHHPHADFFLIFVNGGPKSASSVEHAHAQIVGREDVHFAYPELVAARCPPDYWCRLHAAHRQLGLAVVSGDCAAWASLAPVKERDLTALSANITDGARFVYQCWKALAGHGTKNFSLAAVISPAHFAGRRCPERFARWPSVVWRFVDRGDPQVRHGDIGTLELFGSTVAASDPFDTGRLLAQAFPASGGS